jgi:Transglycosylase SLT domain
MTPPTPRRPLRRAWRVLLSALAGGGLTAVGLGTPLAGEALGASPSGKRSNGGSVPLTVTESGSGSTPSGSGSPSPGGQSTGTTPTTSTPTTSAPSTSTSTTPLIVTPEPEHRSTAAAPRSPAVAVQRQQQTTRAKSETPQSTAAKPAASGAKKAPATGNNVALAPQLVAAQASLLAAELAGSAASVQALSYYRIPLFLLPIYQAAAAQYGVPWQILAAINEIETDYGNDVSVSTAGAVGWMQFMPATWIQYGVDALNAGYADPYNPVDAIFAAARYLSAAGASSNLRAAILAYNHSAEYVSSVLLRAKLISSYPNPVIATLTDLTSGRLPVRNGKLTWDSIARLVSPSSATAQARALTGAAAPGASGEAAAPAAPAPASAPSPSAAAASAKRGHAAEAPLQLVDLTTSPNATVVAVQDGRIVKVGSSRALGRYVILRDVYGDVFTYAGMGSIAASYRQPQPTHAAGLSPAVTAAAAGGPGRSPSQPSGATRKAPITLHVKRPRGRRSAGAAEGSRASSHAAPAGVAPLGKVRLYAHPGNPDALAASTPGRAQGASSSATRQLPLRGGAILAKGTVLGHARTPHGARDGHLRFAIRPAGDRSTVDPRPILENWSRLNAALHPQGAPAEADLLGATASGVFLLSKSDLEREVLSDPGISIDACGRQAVAFGAVDRRVLAVLAFLSRSGLKPTVSGLRCAHAQSNASGLPSVPVSGDAVDISAIDGIAIAGSQGPGTVTDVTIRTLLTLRGEFVPHEIISLMQYPGAANTLATPETWDHIHVGFRPLVAAAQASPAAAAAAAAHSARTGAVAPPPLLVGGELSSTQWNQLITHIATLRAPTVAVKPSSTAIPVRRRP